MLDAAKASLAIEIVGSNPVVFHPESGATEAEMGVAGDMRLFWMEDLVKGFQALIRGREFPTREELAEERRLRVQELADVLKKTAPSGSGSDDYSRIIAVYEVYTSRFIADNSNIWTSNSIFTPAAFALLAAYFAIDDPGVPASICLLMTSQILATAALAIAEKHRRFQDESKLRVDAAESLLFSPDGLRAKKLSSANFTDRWADRVGIGRMRHILYGLISAAWLYVLAKLIYDGIRSR